METLGTSGLGEPWLLAAEALLVQRLLACCSQKPGLCGRCSEGFRALSRVAFKGYTRNAGFRLLGFRALD